MALPLVNRSGRAVGREASQAEMNIMDEVMTNETVLGESNLKRAHESTRKLKTRAKEKFDKFTTGVGLGRLAAP